VIRRLIRPVLLLAAAFAIGRATITHDGVGPLEYAVAIVLVALLVGWAVRLTLRAARPA